MSSQCVDAVIELANEHRVPLMLIASRRQIECEAQGGGYVNGWNTESFARYVRERDRGEYVLLCRDHGGPWQNYPETQNRLPLRQALESSVTSFQADIESGFDILHIDPSIDIHDSDLRQERVHERLFELYDRCMEIANRNRTSIAIEIGSEEQSGLHQDIEVLENLLEGTRTFCNHRGYPIPLFVVAQTGTLVKETRNVGTFESPFRMDGNVPAEVLVPRLVDLCRNYGVFLKEHNADYLSDESLSWHPRLGIHATNIAPELGVAQSRRLLQLCDDFAMQEAADGFLALAFRTEKWKKWLLPGSTTSDRERAIIAGHYTFGMPEFSEFFERLARECSRHGIDLDRDIRETHKAALRRFMTCFRLLPP